MRKLFGLLLYRIIPNVQRKVLGVLLEAAFSFALSMCIRNGLLDFDDHDTRDGIALEMVSLYREGRSSSSESGQRNLSTANVSSRLSVRWDSASSSSRKLSNSAQEVDLWVIDADGPGGDSW
jgi:hypothetical protein